MRAAPSTSFYIAFSRFAVVCFIQGRNSECKAKNLSAKRVADNAGRENKLPPFNLPLLDYAYFCEIARNSHCLIVV